jgi:hypothetical protein
MSEKLNLTRDSVDSYCCTSLIKAEADGFMSTATGGVWLGSGTDTGCMSGFPIANFCPFCGSKIVTVQPDPKAGRSGWSWHTEAVR